MPDAPTLAISVLVLDDHALFREGVARLLSSEDGFVVFHCGSIDEALALLRSHRIDIVLLDLDLGTSQGVAFLPLARHEGFDGKVLVVAAQVDRADAATLTRQGVAGILTKRETASKLADSIRDVVAGNVRLDQRLLQDALAVGEAGPAVRTTPFTARERVVLGLVFEGLANKEIADRIGVSESAVKATLQQLFGKTGVRTRSQLVRIVLERHGQDI
jgi:two-component system nitrate/nitrite response regulator NarL